MNQKFANHVDETIDEIQYEDPIQGRDIMITGLPGIPSHFEVDTKSGYATGVLRVAIPMTPSVAKDPMPELAGIEIWALDVDEKGGTRMDYQIYNLMAYGPYEARSVCRAGKGIAYMLYEIPVSVLPIDESESELA